MCAVRSGLNFNGLSVPLSSSRGGSSSDRADTLSEISETSTTGTGGSCYSSDAREELNGLAISLGLTAGDDLYKDRFRVDRKKLENLLLGNMEVANSAQDFFQKIMNDTRTLILWPSRLKIGAKSKKDPHIKIAGLMDDVTLAKSKVMGLLDSRSNRVTMKLDVSYTDHSHIIGKGGLRIKGVMEETGCHIHFPDSNRSNQEEKSNQVSIAGEISAIEKARARVRELTPLIFCFELPNVGTIHGFPELTSPYITKIQETYNVQVMFRTRAKLHSTFVMVKGCEWEVARVKEATVHLINNMCDAFANQVSVQMMMEISQQYHSLILGANHQNLKAIMQQTGVQVMFPDASDPNTPSLKKSSVTITGVIHSVYQARQMLLGSLPIVVMFDVMPEMITLNAEFLEDIMRNLDVYISIRHKAKQNIFSVVIKGLERNVANIYEARRRLMGLKEKLSSVHIPDSYQISLPVPSFLRSFSASSNFSNVSQLHPLPSCFPGNKFNFPSPRPSLVTNPLMQHLTEQGLNCNSQHLQQAAVVAATMLQQKLRQQQQILQQRQQFSTPDKMYCLGPFTLPEAKEYQPYSSLSSTASTLSSPAGSPRTNSPSCSVANLCENSAKLDLNDSRSGAAERRAPGFERNAFSAADYQKLRIQAVQAMQGMPSRGEVRVPTPTWSGYGFSHSSPSSILQDYKKDDVTSGEEEIGANVSSEESNSCVNVECSRINLATSNYLDAASSSTINAVTSSNYSDLASQLATIGLQKYIHLFKSHEIDSSTFRTLTEADLKEIGVTALGARRKMLLFISELKKRDNIFKGSAAPGAERKCSTPTSLRKEQNNW